MPLFGALHSDQYRGRKRLESALKGGRATALGLVWRSELLRKRVGLLRRRDVKTPDASTPSR